PQCVIDAVSSYYLRRNANRGGGFLTSDRTDETVAAARAAMADLLNAPEPQNIVFGANMTSLAFHLARSISDIIRPGDEVVVTDLDHDANVAPWTDLAAAGAVIRPVAIQVPECVIDMDSFRRSLSERTRLVAIPYASNAAGTICDVKEMTRLAKQAGALVFVDAVQYAPHGPIDVQEIGCDFLACSSYKFFGPHAGALFGAAEPLTRLKPHKVRPASNRIPDCWETGTQNHEGLAGIEAAVGYLESVGRRFGAAHLNEYAGFTGRRRTLKAAMKCISDYEATLSRALLSCIQALPGARVYGITDVSRLGRRVPTVSFTWPAMSPAQTARYLAGMGIFCWTGNMYALRLTERLGLEQSGGLIRIGLAHYNTLSEIDSLARALTAAARAASR
ncbi:MAG TPA: cysteine desulfurase-like protein, partial [Chthonomonadales bacterium]|nr:cysteine desulfurase-like protein [Chthonomonadales bacterium]